MVVVAGTLGLLSHWDAVVAMPPGMVAVPPPALESANPVLRVFRIDLTRGVGWRGVLAGLARTGPAEVPPRQSVELSKLGHTMPWLQSCAKFHPIPPTPAANTSSDSRLKPYVPSTGCAGSTRAAPHRQWVATFERLGMPASGAIGDWYVGAGAWDFGRVTAAMFRLDIQLGGAMRGTAGDSGHATEG